MAETQFNEVVDLTKKYLAYLQTKKMSFNKVLLFGSYANGKQKKYSDIDIAIFSDEWKQDKIDTQIELLRLASDIDARLEPHPFDSSDLEDPDPFVEEILKYGKLIS